MLNECPAKNNMKYSGQSAMSSTGKERHGKRLVYKKYVEAKKRYHQREQDMC